MKRLLTTLALAALTACPALAQTVAVTNGRVVTNTAAGQIDGGTVLIRDGDIIAVGRDLEIPADAQVIDAQGRWVTPGLFHPHTQLGLVEIGAESSTRDTSADDSPFSAALDISDGFNPSGTYIDEARVGGITRFALFPSTGETLFAGTGALANSTGDADSLFASTRFMVADLSRSGASLAGGSKPAAWAYLRAAMDDARFHPGRFMSTQQGVVLNRTDAAALVPVIRGEMPLVIFAESAADIRRVIAFKQEFPAIRVIIAGGSEAPLVAGELASAGIPVIYDPMRNLPDTFDSIASSLDGAARLFAAGVDVAFTTVGSDIYFNARLLTQHAAIAVTHGADWGDAFRAITLTPAELYGEGDRYGALDVGYAGDVVVWDGDPLEVMSAPTHVVIDGSLQSLETRQTRLRDRYAEIRAESAYGYNH